MTDLCIYIIPYRLTGKNVGRYIVATESIPCNAPIIREKAFSIVPIRDKSNQIQLPSIHVCGHCGQSTTIDTSVFCLKCRNISYCNEDCLRKDYTRLHEFECDGFSKDLWYELGISHLALHTMLLGVHGLFERKNSTDPSSKWYSTPEGWHELIIQSANNLENFSYEEVLSLESYTEKECGDDNMRYILVEI